MTALQKKQLKEALIRQIIKYNGLYRSLIYRPAKYKALDSAQYVQGIAHKYPMELWVDTLIDNAILPKDEKKCLVESASMERLRTWWTNKLEEIDDES